MPGSRSFMFGWDSSKIVYAMSRPLSPKLSLPPRRMILKVSTVISVATEKLRLGISVVLTRCC